MTRVKRLWSNLGIRYKLFAAVLFAVSIPFILLLYIHLSMSAKESKVQADVSALRTMEETKSYLEYKANSIHEVLNFISFNDVIQNEARKTKGYDDVNEWSIDASRVDKVLHQFPYNQEIESVRLYLHAGLAGEAGNNDYLKMDQIADRVWLRKFKESKRFFAWVPATVLDRSADGDKITILRKIPEEHSVTSFSGLASAQIAISSLRSVLDHVKLTPNTSAFLFNERGDLLSASTAAQLKAKDVEQMTRDKKELFEESYRWGERVNYQGKTLLIGATAIQNAAMRLVVVVPESDILKTIYHSRNRLIYIFLIIIPFVLPLSFFVAGSSTRRMRQLSRHMRKIKDGNFHAAQLTESRDEIGELIQTYNAMVQNIGKLMDETYHLGREVKNKELKALQAQINPHFLYNTLDLINIMAIESEEQDISMVVEELAVFYKLSLSNGREMITLENEIKHVEAYVHIQNMRFGGGIALSIELSDELKNCEVPKIILQPLVENAILHGIREKDSEQGIITVKAESKEGRLLLHIRDDGVGMDEKQMTGAMAGKSSKRTGGFGVRNIQERIDLLFGADFGLSFASTVGEGTTVTIKLPLEAIVE
ncbi:cache domain-containing sensor histidine kinase [Paenibacillus sp. LPE1-1-1.1]|uniref:cache domain-containing sensor histidine kinase n=1 Tax=Paenibacillus sp. LPE1-1-1.1 TaxID=3135230 RepID=UPI00343BFB01